MFTLTLLCSLHLAAQSSDSNLNDNIRSTDIPDSNLHYQNDSLPVMDFSESNLHDLNDSLPVMDFPESNFHHPNDSLPVMDSINSNPLELKDSIPVTDTLSKERMDSVLREMKLLLESLSEPKSFFTFETSVGNRNYSLHNNIFNAQQSTTNIFTLVPTASYVHKSGFGLSAAAYLTWESAPQFFQYALSPSYDHFGKKFGYGVSYTHYFTEDDLEYNTTPIKREIYSYINTKKGWLRPGIAAGWATGNYREITRFDTTILGVKRTLIDTSTVELSGITLMASVMHPFSWDNIFTKRDNFSLIPQLSIIAGTENYQTNSQGRLITQTPQRRYVRRYNTDNDEKSGFGIQSFAFSQSHLL